jgi:glycerophosphoryl diester phosphodiesterase
VLVARHENEIGSTTDIAGRPELADRMTTKVVDGRELTGWFTEDLTLAELKSLRAIERVPLLRPRNTRYDGRYDVPTFDEILDLVAEESQRLGRRIGVYPETKHPSYFAGLGLAVEEPLLAALDGRDLPVFIQSFEPGNLRWLRSRTHLPLVQLVSGTGRVDLVTSTGLRRVAEYADAVGVDKALVSPAVVAGAHEAGLQVHAWTLRDETDSIEDTQRYLDIGVDGLFTDHPDTTLEAWRLHTSGIRIHAAT